MPEHVLVLGGSGFIGKACIRSLQKAGYRVTGVSRSKPAGLLCNWKICDLARIDVGGIQSLLQGVDVVVNAAGALQDGARDDLEAIHVGLINNLVEAIGSHPVRVVQVSAAGVRADHPTAFFSTKARGDAVLAESGINHIILRPALVIGPEAYGGTALLRAHAALPLIEWDVFGDARVQTIGISDVVKAVRLAVEGRFETGFLADISEEKSQNFSALSRDVRAWMGLPSWNMRISVPLFLTHLIGKAADVVGWLGWRSPMRTTALQVLQEGVHADLAAWRKAGGFDCHTLQETLAGMPAHTQERWFARMFLFLPLSVVTLSVFWLASGLIGLWQAEAAQSVFHSRGMDGLGPVIAVYGGAFVDILLGSAILWRRWARSAAIGMILISLSYLFGAMVITPDLWKDPLGPMVKVIPATVLALLPLWFLEDR